MSKKKKDWKTEKERLLRLDREERRKDYRRPEFIPLDKIPTWREENKPDDKEEEEGTELTGGGGGGGLTDKVSLYKGDITVLEVDAIVNAANSSLLGGGGVDGCIHKAAGSCLYDECHSLNGCETGKAKITCGYDLPARYVIHTVGPVARGHVGQSETSDLTSCYQNSLRLMKEHGLSTVAFPCISTGIYGFPNEPAAEIALSTVKSWIEENPDKITRVIFCVFLETDFAIYKKKIPEIFQDNDMEVTEEQLQGDNNPPSAKSKEDSEESGRGKEEAGDEEEDDNDAVGNEDVEMESQNPDDITETPDPTQAKDNDDTENQDKEEDAGTDSDNKKDEKDKKDEEKDTDDPKEKDEEEDKAEDEPPAEKTDDDDNTVKSTVEMEDVSEVNDTGTSNGEEIKERVESPEEPDSILTDSNQSKDTVEKKE
ncbi:ADP-ribose glycohydrolase MACROD2 isoform X1 [Labrus mixtus]|uniref:ADP-ribose glycohydrolase MACROD2 isoform X1 n=1 Tax=Labrus mixtus TaxID=508554 RepID=UPI0029BFABB7|nr:ADP-ribose glycohydrolase MACROD2 isoform X1 [Labrus mixtus]